MLSQSQKKHIKSLHLKKYRTLHGSYLVEGNKICKEILLSHLPRIKCICCTSDWHMTNEHMLLDNTDITFNLPLTELKKLSNLKTPPPVLMELAMPEPITLLDTAFDTPMFYLDRIQDPGNLGTIIRISDWFGFKYLLLSEGCVDAYSPKVIQSSMGSHTRVHLLKSDLSKLKTAFPDVAIWAADMNGKPIQSIRFPSSKAIFVIGNEGQGLDLELGPIIHQTVSIPGAYSLGAESLNAAITAGILANSVRSHTNR